MLCGALFLGTAALTSCSEDESYDVYGSNTNKVFFDPYANPVQTNDIYITPAGVFGVVGGQFNVKAQYASDERITVGAEVDNSLVAAYNKKNETSYAVLPTEAMNALKVEAAVIQPGKSVSENPVSVTVPSEACGSLTEEYYLVPMRLCVEGFEKNGSSYEVGVRDTFNTVYAVVHNAGSDFIYTKGSFEQTNAVVVTPVGVFGGVNASFNVAVRANNDAEFTIKASVDNSLIATYNTKHGTEYTAVPADIASKLVIGEGKIAAGQLETSPAVTVTDPTKAAENIENDCILPLKMTFVYPNGTEAELPNAYVIITKKTSFINDDASTDLYNVVLDNADSWVDARLVSNSLPIWTSTVETTEVEVTTNGETTLQTQETIKILPEDKPIPTLLNTAAKYYAASDIILSLYNGEDLPTQFDAYFQKAEQMVDAYITQQKDLLAKTELRDKNPVKHRVGLSYYQRKHRRP